MKILPNSLWFLFIYITSSLYIINGLRIKYSNQLMMKQLINEQSVDSLFLKLMISSNSKDTSGLLLLSKLLASETSPFRRQYTKYCREYSIFTFLTIQKLLKAHKHLDFTQILSVDCISASQIKFNQYEPAILQFFKTKGIHPILSNNFKPSQWSLNAFFNFVRDAVAFQLKPDWSSWCGDVDLENDHFHPDLWNSNDKLWRFLNYKCIERMNQSKRITVRWKFLSIFKGKNHTSKEALMKIVSIAAAYRVLNDANGYLLLDKRTTEANLKDLYSFENSLNTRISRVAARLIKYCGVNPKHSAISLTKFLPEIYALLQDEPNVNSSWLLNLIYVIVRSSVSMLGEGQIIDWFFALDPSVTNICQLLELSGKFRVKLRKQIILRLNQDNVLFSKCYKECPAQFKSNSIVPFENRIKTLLKTQLKFPKHSIELKILHAHKDQFWYLLRVIIETEKVIFNHNCAIFKEGFGLYTFRSLDHFFEHFLQTFLTRHSFYHNLGNEKGGRPVIIPNIRIPEKVVQILVSVLARSAILNFKVPFYLYFDLFKTALDARRFQFQRVLKMKKEFYSYQYLTDKDHVKDCDYINRNENDLDFLVDYLKKVGSELPSLRVVSQWTVLDLIEGHQNGIRSAIKNIFPSDIPFSYFEMYSLIFNR
jgi:hypothetical protein